MMWTTDWQREIEDATFKRVLENRFGSGTSEATPQTPHDAYWEDHFCNVIAKGKLHGSSDECFENAAYKVRRLYINTPRTLETERALLSLVERALVDPDIVEYGRNGLNMLVAHLLWRYPENAACREFARMRIQTLSTAIEDYGYELYLGDGEAKGVPTAFRGKRVVNPDLIESDMVSLPQIHDILYFHIIGRGEPERQPQIDRILEYILSDEYQAFPEGYGVGRYGKRYYAIGWSITVPSFTANEIGPSTLFNLIHLSQYRVATKSEWFRNMLRSLEGYRTSDGFYQLPRGSIREVKNRYFVGGEHLGVVANRRLKNRQKVESTYWCSVIKDNAQNAT